MDGNCVDVADHPQYDGKRAVFIRDVSLKAPQGIYVLTSMNLKLPSVLNIANIDSSKWKIDHESLDFTSYTITMIDEMFAYDAVENCAKTNAQVLSLGLGAGYINSYLHKNYPKMNITAVEIDKNMLDLALKWFDLKLDDKHHVVIEDGINYVRRMAEA
ncbi:unnamed protein product, partial [Strongylus vulgaris]